MGELKTCGNCMYCVPLLTAKGEGHACFCPDSKKMYKAVDLGDSCNAWRTDEYLEGEE